MRPEKVPKKSVNLTIYRNLGEASLLEYGLFDGVVTHAPPVARDLVAAEDGVSVLVHGLAFGPHGLADPAPGTDGGGG